MSDSQKTAGDFRLGEQGSIAWHRPETLHQPLAVAITYQTNVELKPGT